MAHFIGNAGAAAAKQGALRIAMAVLFGTAMAGMVVAGIAHAAGQSLWTTVIVIVVIGGELWQQGEAS